MRVEKKLRTDEGVILQKKSTNKPHSLFKPKGSKLGKKVMAYSPEITVPLYNPFFISVFSFHCFYFSLHGIACLLGFKT